MLTIATCLWAPNASSQSFSRNFDEAYVEKLYRGFKRNLTQDFDFVCFTDRMREFREPIWQMPIKRMPPTYGTLIEPFKIEGPLIVCGLDMVVLGNIDHFAKYCESATTIACPRDPYQPSRLINPIVLVPQNLDTNIYRFWNGENDMEHLRRFGWQAMDDLWPGDVISLKFHKVRDLGTQGAKIIYMHGTPKPHELEHLDWVKKHWE